jgi:DNA-binding LytR/AlgR family response regulator
MSDLKKILIVEDELVIAENTKYMIHELYPSAEVRIGGSSAEANDILLSFSPDLILLDIRLGKNDNGIVFSKQLTQENVPFIFITAHEDKRTISDAIHKDPIGYLVKPISLQDLNVNLKLAISKIDFSKFIEFRDGKHDVRLGEKDIVYLSFDEDYTNIYTKNKRYTVRKSMSEVLEVLTINLVQIHRDYYVNPSFVVEADTSVHLATGHQLPLSSKYKNGILDQLF